MTEHMTYHDYARMASNYYSQAEIIKQKLADERMKKHFETVDERKWHEGRVHSLYEMHRDCMLTYYRLIEIAEYIKEREGE